MVPVSIIIPHFERVDLLRQTIQSVTSQQHNCWEVIVVDDGSRESEWNAIQLMASDRVRVLKRAGGQKGPSLCRNLGAAAATGDYLLFLDSDDLLADFCIRQRLAHVESHPNADLWVFPVELFRDQAGDLKSPWNHIDLQSDDLARFLRGDSPWCVSSPLWRRQAFINLGGFNDRVFYGDDAELHIRALLCGLQIQRFPDAAPDAFIRRSDIPRITNSIDPELLNSRLIRLEEVTAALRKSQIAAKYQAIWEGQYFVECEFLLFNVDRPHDAIGAVLDRWGELYQPSPMRQWLVKRYFAFNLRFLKRYYLLVRISRRLAMLLLPSDYFPKTRETRSGRGLQGARNRTSPNRRMTLFIQFLRRVSLSKVNQRRLRTGMHGKLQRGTTPIYFIFTPDIVHFAPYCVPTGVAGLEAVLVLNSVSESDEKWLRTIHPDRVIISLKVSLSGNRKSMMSHGEVLNDLFAISDQPFCIQDPDCFVTDPSFWSQVELDSDRDLACGPFTKKPTDHNHVLPDTFFLKLNPSLFKDISKRYRISASNTKGLIPAAQKMIQRLDYYPGQYPEQFKGYFDTLQAFWLLALSEGYQFRQISGAGQIIFHIGGTSYLHASDYDLTHDGYWPLSVIYINLRLLEIPAGERFRARFKGILDRFGSSDRLLTLYPEFNKTSRFTEIQTLLAHIVK